MPAVYRSGSPAHVVRVLVRRWESPLLASTVMTCVSQKRQHPSLMDLFHCRSGTEGSMAVPLIPVSRTTLISDECSQALKLTQRHSRTGRQHNRLISFQVASRGGRM